MKLKRIGPIEMDPKKRLEKKYIYIKKMRYFKIPLYRNFVRNDENIQVLLDN
jgi:hypothetical protein